MPKFHINTTNITVNTHLFSFHQFLRTPLLKQLARKFGHFYPLSEFFLRHYFPQWRRLHSRPGNEPTAKALKAAYLEHCTTYRKQFIKTVKFSKLGGLNDLAVDLVEDLQAVAKRPVHWVPLVGAMAETGLLKTIGK